MCGIAGFVGDISHKQKDWLSNALDIMHHRGPDGNGKFEYNNVMLGHTRLSIIDLSAKGNQPMHNKHLSIVMNGEIYNYKELLSYLYADDDLGSINTGNDCHTFLAYAHKYGVNQAMQSSNGMWAFALYNRSENIVTLSVDRFGQKPLFYYEDENGFYFASVPSALYPLKETWKVDSNALETYWQLGAIIGPDRIFKGIKKLCAGEKLTYNIKTKQYKIERWYEPKERQVTDIRELIFDAINLVKVADVPVNVFLSGGIDSTIVASQQGWNKAIHLSSIEEEYAKDAADKFGLDLQIANPALYSMDYILTDIVTKSGEPTMAGAIPYMTSQVARQYGKVSVIANGADELFFGYDRLRDDNNEFSVNQNNHMFRGSAFAHSKLNKYRHKFNGKWSSRLTDLMTFVQFDINATLDYASMAHGLEMRSPFLDHRVVEAALTIPESKHRQNGNKTILKNILLNLGFTESWVNRPKVGFSLHYSPSDTDLLKQSAWKWAIDNKFLQIPKSISARDEQYLKASAMGFFIWFHQHYKYL